MSRDIFLEELFANSVQSALSKNYIFESPRDDEIIEHAVTKWDWVVAVWVDKSSLNGFRMLSISGLDKIGAEDVASYIRGNSVMVLDEATALKWQAIHGDSSWPH